MDLWVREARIFKYGSGVGTNFQQHPRRRRETQRRRNLQRPDELPQNRRPCRHAIKKRRYHAVPPKWFASISITLKSSSSSTGKWKKNKVAALIAAGCRAITRRSVSHRKRAEQQQLHPHTERIFNILDQDGEMELKARSDGRVMKKVKATELWNQINYAAWRCVPIPVPSTIPPSTNGIPAPGAARSGLPIPAANTCSSITPPATWQA